MPAKFVLIGSGLAGGSLTAYLGRPGYYIDLYERGDNPREGKLSADVRLISWSLRGEFMRSNNGNRSRSIAARDSHA
jgi:choline dehydrogenase-like flavoprotein